MNRSVEITIDDKDLKELFQKLQAKFQDLTPVMRKIAGVMQDSVEENFSVEGRPGWPRSHRAIAQNGKTLQNTGRLAGSITPKATGTSAIVGTNVAYAGMMQFGAKKGEFGKQQVVVHGHFKMLKSGKKAWWKEHTKRQLLPWGDIPARPFLMIQDDDWIEIKNTLSDYLFTI